jgi:lipopolysaccharide transport system permease protein
MMGKDSRETPVTVVSERQGWTKADIQELKEYRDLFYFLVWRDIKVLYAQTILGFAWAILNPLIQIVLFTVIFGKIAKVPTDGIPYLLFSTVAIIPWTYMSEAMVKSGASLVSDQNMLGKIYFPRLIFPFTPVLAKLVDLGISLLLLAGIMVFYRVPLTWNLLLLPLLLPFMILIPAGIGIWLSALAIRYRDVKFAMPFVLRMLIYSAPILYSASSIPETYRIPYSLNPIVGVIEGFRSCLLGTPLQIEYVFPGAVMAVILFITGALYFKKMEAVFVDVI